MKKVIIGIRSDPDWKKEAQAQAKKLGMSLSDLIWQCIGYAWESVIYEPVKQSDNDNSSPCDDIT